MKKLFILMGVACCVAISAYAAGGFTFRVVPGILDPTDTDLVNSVWLGGLGCPPAPSSNTALPCSTGSATDVDNEGILFIKTGPTTSKNIESGAVIVGESGITLTELGFDIRSGSHCSARAPRFEVKTTMGMFFLGCSSGAAGPANPLAPGWTRRRWTQPSMGAGIPACQTIGCTPSPATPIKGIVLSIEIIMDEGQDTAPNSGLAILDNIDINGVLVGKP